MLIRDNNYQTRRENDKHKIILKEIDFYHLLLILLNQPLKSCSLIDTFYMKNSSCSNWIRNKDSTYRYGITIRSINVKLKDLIQWPSTKDFLNLRKWMKIWSCNLGIYFYTFILREEISDASIRKEVGIEARRRRRRKMRAGERERWKNPAGIPRSRAPCIRGCAACQTRGPLCIGFTGGPCGWGPPSP